MDEIALKGGRSTEGVVRVGNTVRRPLRPNSSYSHFLLELLEHKRFSQSPRFLGIDDKNREILTFIEGDVAFGKSDWTDEQLVKIAGVLREFHDASYGTDLTQGKEVVCHNDFAPWNLIMRDDNIVGIIDFDDIAPGNRADDFSYFIWTFLELGNDTPIDAQSKRISMLANAYNFHDGHKFVNSLLSQQEKILQMRQNLSINANSEEARVFSSERVEKIQSEIAWTKHHRLTLERSLS